MVAVEGLTFQVSEIVRELAPFVVRHEPNNLPYKLLDKVNFVFVDFGSLASTFGRVGQVEQLHRAEISLNSRDVAALKTGFLDPHHD